MVAILVLIDAVVVIDAMAESVGGGERIALG